MKTALCVVLALPLLAPGCGEKPGGPASPTNAASSDGSPLTAPVDYLKAVTKGQQDAVKTVDATSLNQAIELFNVDKGRYPKDLNELVEQKFIRSIPTPPYGTKLVYDAGSGKVTVVKQ